MLELLKPLWLTIAKWAAAISGIGLLLFKVRQSGKEAVEQKDLQDTLNGVKTRDKIESNIAGSSDDKLNKLLNPYYRD